MAGLRKVLIVTCLETLQWSARMGAMVVGLC